MGKKKRITWHIGVNKTGSTALEHFCLQQHNWLQHHNVSFLSKALFYQQFWGLYYQSAITESQLAYYQQLFDQVVSTLPSDHVVMIDEDITLRNPLFEGRLIRYQTTIGRYHNNFETMLKRLSSLTKHHDLHIVLYVRRQDLFLESLYGHNIKTRHGFALPFSDFLERYPLELLDWNACASLISSYFGKDHFTVKIYDRDKLKNSDIVADFFDFLDTPIVDYQLDDSLQNNRINYEHFEMVRAFNKVKVDVHPKYYLRGCPQRYCHLNKPYGFMDYTSRCRFLDHFNLSNQTLSKQWLNQEMVFKHPNPSLIVLDQSAPLSLSQDKINQLTQEFFNKAN